MHQLSCSSALAADKTAALMGLSVLVVEDTYLIADEMAQHLRGRGATVHGPFSKPGSQIPAEVVCAVLDIGLDGALDFQTARKCVALGVPVIFVTGYDRLIVPVDLTTWPLLLKPVSFAALIEEILHAVKLRPRMPRWSL